MLLKYAKNFAVATIAALITIIMSVVFMWIAAFMILPLLQTWATMRYQRGNYVLDAIVTITPWAIIFIFSKGQSSLTEWILRSACQSSIVGVALYGVQKYIYPTIKSKLNSM